MNDIYHKDFITIAQQAGQAASIILLAGLLFGSFFYSGNIFIYIGFCFIFSAVLLRAFRHTFSWLYLYLAVFMFLAFPIKIFMYFIVDQQFRVPLGDFQYRPEDFDSLLYLSSLGGLGIFFAKIVLDRLSFGQESTGVTPSIPVGGFKILSILFVLAVFGVVMSNLIWGFFHVGLSSRTVLPFKLTSLIFWAHNFGLIFFLVYILNLPPKNQQELDSRAFLILFLGIALSLSVFSRAPMLFVAFPLFLAMFVKNYAILQLRNVVKYLILWVAVFALVLVTVTYERAVSYSFLYNTSSKPVGRVYSEYLSQLIHIFVDRWVGLEGVAAIHAYPQKGWDLFRDAIFESSDTGIDGIYQKIISSPYLTMTNKEKARFRFGSEPGLIAFLLYSGNNWVVFVGVFFMTGLMMIIERLAKIFSGQNVYLVSFVGCALANLVVQFTYVKMSIIYIVALLATLIFFRVVVSTAARVFIKYR